MSDASTKPVRILLVDDEEDLVTFLSHRLLKRGYTVTAKTAGPDAVAVACKQQTFDVAIVDLKMPEMDGIEVLQRLKECQPFLQVVMLTGHGSHESALEAGKLQAYRYLLKPYEFDELVTLIEEAAAEKRRVLQRRFQEEHAKAVAEGATALEIKDISDRLRREYEQD